MTHGPTAGLRRAIRSVAKGDQPGVTDRELLRRFTADADQAAFAVLVWRHSNMVMGVCRRLLPTVPDAEDACQATFLVLARKAKDMRWQPSVANWLYLTARKVARNARVAAQRRARREVRAAVPEAFQPVDRITGRELVAALDEELERLPPHYREPLVLCYLEGLTRDEAATRLGIPIATLHTRIDRGRKRLHEALTRGGFALGAGLLAFAVISPAEASPPRLVRSILATASGSAPDAVAQLVKGVAVNGMMNKAVLSLAALITVVALGIGLGSLTPTAAGQKPDQPAPAANKPRAKDVKPAPDDPKAVAFSGRVLDPDGKPLSGAKLSLHGDQDRPADLGKTGVDGRFKVEVPAGGKGLTLVAQAEGVGMDFLNLDKHDSAAEVELRTVKDRVIRGRIVSTQGKPVAGVRVTVEHVGVYGKNSLDPFLAEWKTRNPHSGLPGGTRHLGANGPLAPVITDAAGRFAVLGTGEERLIELRLSGAGTAEARVVVVNRDGFDPEPYNKAMADKLSTMGLGYKPKRLLYGPELSVVVETEKPIRGVVKDLDTGDPRAGIRVSLAGSGDGILMLPLSSTTDVRGQYEIKGARKAPSYTVEVETDPTAGYMAGQAEVTDSGGYEPVAADIKVKKGVIVNGRVIDRATGRPVPGFAMAPALGDNPFVKDYPGYNESAWLRMVETAEDGTFRLVTLPGPVLLMGGPDNRKMADGRYKYKAATPDPKYSRYFEKYAGATAFRGSGGIMPLQGNFCKVLEIKPNAGVVTEDILLEPASALPVKMQDAEGRALSGVWVTGVSAEDWHFPIRIEKESCPAYNLEPGKPRLMVFHEPAKNLFGTLSLTGREKDEAVVKLGPGATVKGRVIDDKGRPLAGVPVNVKHRDRTAAEMQAHVLKGRTVETDADGRFQIDGTVPGTKFSLEIGRGQKAFDLVEKAEDHGVQAGGTADLGDVKVKPRPGFNGE